VLKDSNVERQFPNLKYLSVTDAKRPNVIAEAIHFAPNLITLSWKFGCWDMPNPNNNYVAMLPKLQQLKSLTTLNLYLSSRYWLFFNLNLAVPNDLYFHLSQVNSIVLHAAATVLCDFLIE
jgi:hypothetical protein